MLDRCGATRVAEITDAPDPLTPTTPSLRPRLVRGDCGFGNEATLEVCESRNVDYLFRLRPRANVKKLITRLFHKDGWRPADCGYEAYEATLKLVGWTRERRVVVLRRRVRDKHGCIAVENVATAQLSFLDDADPIKLYEHVVLVTSLGRAAHPKARREAITSRPMLLNAVGRQTEPAGQRHLLITSMHVAKEAVVLMLTHVHALLGRIKACTVQLLNTPPWHAIAAIIVAQILACKPPNPLTSLQIADG